MVLRVRQLADNWDMVLEWESIDCKLRRHVYQMKNRVSLLSVL